MKNWLKTNQPGSVADKLGNQPLHYAALFGSPESVQVLLDAGASPNARNTAEVTPLIYAGWNAAKVRILLAKGADAKAVSKMRRTALHLAVISTDGAEAARMLLDKGANVNAADAVSVSPLNMKAGGGSCWSPALLIVSVRELGALMNTRPKSSSDATSIEASTTPRAVSGKLFAPSSSEPIVSEP